MSEHPMAVAAVVGYLVWCTTVFVLRNRIHRARTGHSGVVVNSQQLYGKGADLAGFLMLAGFGLITISPWLEIAGKASTLWDAGERWSQIAAIALFLAGTIGTFASQLAMGNAWRIGLDLENKTPLVIGGPYAVVRNPIYSFVLVSALAMVAAVPSVPSIAGVAMVAVGVDLWVRRVEEPFLIAQHGDAYARYAARTGRFLPGVGKGAAT
jgi:protein-S-isoprenylcysteine O-methyltransferase Ste14